MSQGIALLLITPSIDAAEGSALRPGLFTPGKNPVPTEHDAGGLQSQSGRVIVPCLDSEPDHPACSLIPYTVCDTRALFRPVKDQITNATDRTLAPVNLAPYTISLVTSASPCISVANWSLPTCLTVPLCGLNTIRGCGLACCCLFPS